MKKIILRGIFVLIVLAYLTACNQLPASQSTAEEPSAQTETQTVEVKVTQAAAIEPTEAPFQMPQGRLLVYTYREYGEDPPYEYNVINFPDLTVEPYKPLNSDVPFADHAWAFSQGSHYLAFDRQTIETSVDRLILLNTVTGTLTEIGQYWQSNNDPTWSADGRWLEFDVHDQGLYIYDTQSGSLKHVSVQSELSDISAISPAGDRIVYMGGCPEDYLGGTCATDLYVINPDGSGEELLLEVEPGAQIEYTAWSPKGTQIYYSVFYNASIGDSLFSYDVETGLSAMISKQYKPAHALPSYVSPNGQFLALSSFDLGKSIVQVITTSDNSLLPIQLPGGYPSWSLDSRYIASVIWGETWHLLDIETGKTMTIEPDVSPYSEIVGWLP